MNPGKANYMAKLSRFGHNTISNSLHTLIKKNNTFFCNNRKIRNLKELNEIQLDHCLNVCKAPSLLILESPNSLKRQKENTLYNKAVNLK